MTPRTRTALVFVLALVLGRDSAAEEGAALAAEARAEFAGAVDRVDAVIQDENASPAAKRALVERVLERWLDLAFMARAALGPQAKSFSAQELAEFSQEFERYALSRYLARIAREREEDFEIQEATWDERTRTVVLQTVGRRTRSIHNRQRVRQSERVDYRLRKKSGEWRIVNLVIDGADVIRIFRAEFEAVIQRSSPAELIAEIRKHNVRREATNPFEPKTL